MTESDIDSVESVAPYLAQQWHPTLNRGLVPSQAQLSSSRLVWWLGPCGHSWQESPSRRARKGADCPVCTGERTRPGVNDLATTHPQEAAEWTREATRYPLSARDVNAQCQWADRLLADVESSDHIVAKEE
ncbi:zinc-ribbon domain-containing protein [Rhodococcus sp. NPDC076796]|uniref:zinc-ribbon domain-containing protein n=1 Tax=Rhodococcus sp. NPDC076796 TaxID=3154859 RepID=UPI0034505B4D